MKSVGEAMAIGRTFKQAFAKALRSRELDLTPVSPDGRARAARRDRRGRRRSASTTCSRRCAAAPRSTRSTPRTSIDPWFLRELSELVADPLAPFAGGRSYKSVDTCAAEFAAQTPYYYSGWERPGHLGEAHEVERGDDASVVILGSGPNRIGQGIEFDYCCVHAAETVRESGRDAVMINCNPETVSTDYDTSDRPVLRAADARGRARRCARSSSPREWSSSSAARRR